jgi:hypothetical protein
VSHVCGNVDFISVANVSCGDGSEYNNDMGSIKNFLFASDYPFFVYLILWSL